MKNEETNNKKGKIKIFLVIGATIIIFLIVIVIAYFLNKRRVDEKNSPNQPSEKQYDISKEFGKNYPLKGALPQIKQKKLKKEYSEKINKIMNGYNKEKEGNDKDKFLSFTAKQLDTLLRATVPEEKKDFHLKMVLAFTNLSKSLREGNDSDVQESVKKINNLFDEWKKIDNQG